jgi:hypothetical protein
MPLTRWQGIWTQNSEESIDHVGVTVSF